MRRKRLNPWVGIGLDAWRLGLDASSVIGLRVLKIAAGGPEGDAESKRMVEEKMQSGLELQAKAFSGGLGSSPEGATSAVLAHYRRKVSANRRRLMKR